MKNQTLTLLWIGLLGLLPHRFLHAQDTLRVMSYNVENLFDCQDNPATQDEEYLPQGSRHWTPGRYYHKLRQIARTITAAGAWDTPALVGLCEVENDSTLLHLLHRTPLKAQQYRYVMTQGADRRGINVALLYQRDRFRYITHTCHRITFRYHKDKRSRDILHVTGQLASGDTLDVFVCHLPSRYGGEKSSQPDRIEAAGRLKAETVRLFKHRTSPHILIMGDFNDTPRDRSVNETLSALQVPAHPIADRLYNLFYPPCRLVPPGSHKYQGEWSMLDQFVVSGQLLDTANRLHIIPGSARIFSPDFLLVQDKTYRGVRPKRTFYGFKYEGGYSDHLPILVDLVVHP